MTTTSKELPVRAFMIHFSHYAPNWFKLYKPREKALNLDTAFAIVDAMAGVGLNTLVIDCEDGVRFASHPELARPYSAPMDHLAAIADRARAKGIDVVPKLNFSQSFLHRHNDWMRPHNLLFAREEYWPIVFSLVDEVIAAARPRRAFHIGMDEDHDRSHRQYIDTIQRFHRHFQKQGLRAAIWNDTAFKGRAEVYSDKCRAAEEKIGRRVIEIPWDYQRARPEIVRRLAGAGFEVWGAPGKAESMVLDWKRALLRHGGKGIFLTNWIPCRPRWRKTLLDFIRTMGPLCRGGA